MVGCGATADLAGIFQPRLPSTTSVYVADSTRPYSLDNLFNNSQVTIFDDGFLEASEADLRVAFEGSLVPPSH